MLGAPDPDKLFAEDPEFKRYAEEAALAFIMADKKNGLAWLGQMYAYYHTGTTIEQVKEWLRKQRNFMGP